MKDRPDAGQVASRTEASGFLVGPAVFKTVEGATSSLAGSIPVRLRHGTAASDTREIAEELIRDFGDHDVPGSIVVGVDLTARHATGEGRARVSDQKLIETAEQALGIEEQIVAAGIFEPRGTMGGTIGSMEAGFATNNIVGEIAGAAAGIESGRAMSELRDVPRHTLLAVTPSRLYALAAEPKGAHWDVVERFATFDRSRIQVTLHGRVNVRTLTVEDPESGRTYQWEGNRIGPDHAKAIIEALEAEEVDPPQ